MKTVDYNNIDIEAPRLTDFPELLPERFEMPQKKKTLPKRRLAVAIVALAAVTLIAVVIMLLSGLMKVGQVIVSGNSYYSDAEIIAVSGIKGEKYLSVDEKKLGTDIMAACPLIRSVKAKKKFPGKIIIEVEEEPLRYYSENNGVWFSFSALSLRVVEVARHGDRFAEQGLMYIKFPVLDNAAFGEIPTVDSGKGKLSDMQYIYSFISAAESLEGPSDISEYDLSNKYDIIVRFSDGSEIHIGNVSSADDKLWTAYAALEDIRKDTSKPVRIDAENTQRIWYRFIGE
ncbi:MAG: FtsQ-type POTRA domain-containing protein [Clostridia bacterium]|nr:FtsQ-type POTRA domain-containing protein [Clostridia bacterium]MDY3784774.1 FtsQ-type POTRA domain-containing protein [Eubacteriales bacterium]